MNNMKGFTLAKATTATAEDRKLLVKVHPFAARLIEFLGKTKTKRVPGIGVVVSDAELIRKVFLDRHNFSKNTGNASSALWNPIIGDTGLLNMDGDAHLTLRRELAPAFSQKILPHIIEETFTNHIDHIFEPLLIGGTVDISEVSADLAYRTLWSVIGFENNEINVFEFKKATQVLRSVTEGVKIHRKSLTKSQQKTAKQKLMFVETLTKESYAKAETLPSSTVIRVMKASGYSEQETVSLVKALMITGTETIISYIPRMVALFIDSGYFHDVVMDATGLPDPISSGLEEAFRVTVPTPVAIRGCVLSTTVDDVSFKKGDRVILSTVEACRKFGVFNPYAPTNKIVKNLWFGAGVHMCIGLPVAKAEAEIVMKKLVEVSQQVGGLKIIERNLSSRGHTGSYDKLIIGVR